MSNVTEVFLSCEEDGVTFDYKRADGSHGVVVLSSIDAWSEFMKKRGFTDQDFQNAMCSSSMDFPEEYTGDPEVLALVRKLR